MASMEQGFEYGQEMRPWVSPSLIEANYILSLSQMELQQAISAEMNANPALEMEDTGTCPVCGSVLEGTFCPNCLTSQASPADERQRDTLDDYDDQSGGNTSIRDIDPDFDPMALVASDVDALDQILTDVRSILDEREFPICEYIIESLDVRGFLLEPVAAIAGGLGVSEDEVLDVLMAIQEIAPVGVAARDLRECLLLQIDYLDGTGVPLPPLVRPIVDQFLDQFAAHKFGHIAKELDASVEEVEEARDYIRTHLTPSPLQASQAKSWRSPTDSGYVAPDVMITLKEDQLIVEIIDSRHFHLRVNPLYEELASKVGRRHRTNGSTDKQSSEEVNEFADHASERERQHVRHYSNRAKLFMANIQQRRETLLRISQCICELQEGFLRGGVRELRPLTRAVVAAQVGVHESTVSRATANKYIMLPNRQVIPFSDFFTPSLSIKDVIKELIEKETAKGEPLTDRRICDLLLQHGVRIARRTVAKYRAELGILPSTMR